MPAQAIPFKCRIISVFEIARIAQGRYQPFRQARPGSQVQYLYRTVIERIGEQQDAKGGALRITV